jgi:hypothetical protein
VTMIDLECSAMVTYLEWYAVVTDLEWYAVATDLEWSTLKLLLGQHQ